MAQLTKDPISGAYQVKQGDTLSKIASTQGRTLAELIATNPQFSKNPNLIRPGDVVQGPSYSNLTGGTTSGGSTLPQQQTNPTTVNFTTALIQMLKEAQGRDTKGQAGLMKQSQDITGQGLNDATRNFTNPLLAPSSGTSLGMSAQNEFDPLLLSVANQQKLASQNLGNFTDVIKQTQSAYEDEQDRLLRIEEKKQDAIEKAKDRATSAANKNANFDTDAQIRSFAGKMKAIKGEDDYIDPKEWMNARDLWQAYGGSDATFESNFKRYLNPASYTLAGYKGDKTQEEKDLELINSIFN